MHPSPGMNKSLFINTPYWEFLNEMISVSTSGGGKRIMGWGGVKAGCPLRLKGCQFKSLVQPVGPTLGTLLVNVCYLQFPIVDVHSDTCNLEVLLFPSCVCHVHVQLIKKQQKNSNELFLLIRRFLPDLWSWSYTSSYNMHEEQLSHWHSLCLTHRGPVYSVCVSLYVCVFVRERGRENGGWAAVNMTKRESRTKWEDVGTWRAETTYQW